MSRAKAKTSAYEPVTRMALGLLLVLVAGRAMLLEMVRTSIEVYPAAKGDAGGAVSGMAGPTTSLLLDLLCMVPGLLVLARRALDRDWRLRWSWSAAIFLGLGAWSAASVAWSADKFDAAIGAADFLAAGAILWAAVQLVRSWRNFRLTAAVACGLLMVCLVKGIYQKYVEIPRNLANQSGILAAMHVGDAAMGNQLMDRAKALLGFYGSANSFAAVLVMLMAITLGIAIQRLSEDGWGWFVTLLVPVGVGVWVVYLAQCKATIGTGALALIIFAVVALRRGSKWEGGYWAGVATAAAGLAAGVVYGLHREGLPTDSLNFRWRYWIGAMRMFREHPILGAGWGGSNFYEHYLKDRLVSAAEDIRDPHNFFLRYLVELGAIGGALAVAWLMRFWWEATRPNLAEAPQEGNGNRRSAPFVLLVIAAMSLGIGMGADMDFGLPAYPFLADLSLRIMYVLVLTLGGTLAASRSVENPGVDDRPAPWILYGVLAGLATLLVHNLIDFSLTETSVLCLFALLAGAALGIRTVDKKARPGHRWAGVAALSAAGAAWAIGAVAVYVPVLQSEALAMQGDQCIRDSRMQQAEESFMEASKMTPWNWDYPYRGARALNWVIEMRLSADAHLAIPADLLDEAIRDLDRATADDPLEPGPLQLRARLLMARGDPASREAGLADFQKLIRQDPAGLTIRLEYTEALAAMGRKAEARQELEEVARINNQFDPAEPMRLSQMQLDYFSRMLDTAAKKP